MGSPKRSFFARSRTSGTKRSATRSWQSIRLTAVHLRPEFFVAPATARSAARARSSSEKIVQDDQRIVAAELEHLALIARMRGDQLSDGTPPVKVIRSKSGLVIISIPMSPGQPVTTE